MNGQIGPMSQMGQVASGMANMSLMNTAAPELRNQKSLYNSKFAPSASKAGVDVKNTPQNMMSSKIAMKQGQRSDNNTMQFPQSSYSNQNSNNQPYVPNKLQNVHSSQVGKRSNPA